MQTETMNSVWKESNKKLIIHVHYKFDVSTVYIVVNHHTFLFEFTPKHRYTVSGQNCLSPMIFSYIISY